MVARRVRGMRASKAPSAVGPEGDERYGESRVEGAGVDAGAVSSGVRSQVLTVWSRLPEYNVRPSGLNATLLTGPVWPRQLRTSLAVRVSQILTVLSSPADASQRPSPGLKATV